jgi:hypothetical protein
MSKSWYLMEELPEFITKTFFIDILDRSQIKLLDDRRQMTENGIGKWECGMGNGISFRIPHSTFRIQTYLSSVFWPLSSVELRLDGGNGDGVDDIRYRTSTA